MPTLLAASNVLMVNSKDDQDIAFTVGKANQLSKIRQSGATLTQHRTPGFQPITLWATT